MKKLLHISAAFDQPELVQNLVERLAYRKYDIGYGNEKMPEGWKALETSSTEAYVSGTLKIDGSDNNHFDMPFISCFNFTCIKGYGDPYKLIWTSSLN
ncbi:MAG: hypothetical protein JST23_12025 [Bacteroidetes bacterium]|nr:hypothetical protein [Bacteroidota bacterium]